MAQIVVSVKNTSVHADVDRFSYNELGSKARHRASSIPARVTLGTADGENYNAHTFGAPGLEMFPLLPHDEDDYSSMQDHPGPSPLDMDVECMMDRGVQETDVDDDWWGLSGSQPDEAATPDCASVGINIVNSQIEGNEVNGVFAPAYHGLTYGAQVPNNKYRESLTQTQLGLSTAPRDTRESVQRQFSTSLISQREEQRDSYKHSYSGNALAQVLSNARYEDIHDEEERTTVMLMNIPLRYTNSRLMRTMDSEGFAGLYDFVYVPMASARRTSKGYAFVNCVNASIAQRFVSAFNGFWRWSTPSKSVCQAVWATQHQGLHANIDHYRNSTVMGKSVPDEYKPRIFENGVEMPFPARNRKPSTCTPCLGQPRKTDGQQTPSL